MSINTAQQLIPQALGYGAGVEPPPVIYLESQVSSEVSCPGGADLVQFGETQLTKYELRYVRADDRYAGAPGRDSADARPNKP